MRGLGAILTLVLLAGCASPQQQADLALLNRRVEALENEVREGWANALCRPEVRQFLESVREVCNKGESCSHSNINLAVLDADPTHQGRFVALMNSQRHEAIYLSSDLGAKPDFGQRQRLKRLLRRPWLSTTRFLVVANPGPRSRPSEPGWTRLANPAEGRAALVLDLLQRDFAELRDEKHRVQVLLYGFDVKPGESARRDDMVPPGGSLGRSVWVFRVDC